MQWWIVCVLCVLVMPGFSLAQEGKKGGKEHTMQERVKALEERIDKLDRTEAIKQVTEYICPGGEILDTLPPGGRCPDGSIPKKWVTFKKFVFSRRASLAERIEEALAEADAKRVAVGGSARGIVQQVLNPDGRDQLFATGSVDLFFLSEPMTRTTFFVGLEAIGGRGPDEIAGSLSRLNTDVETLGFGVTDQVKVKEGWLHMRLLRDRVEVVGGKLDLSNYFDRNAVANDETSQFLNSSLVNNPLLALPPNGPGLAVRFEPGRAVGFGLGVQSPNNSGATIAQKVYVIAELDYNTHVFFSRKGDYRLWGRAGRIPESLEKKTWGVGGSLDQEVSSRTTAFVRAGIGRAEGEDRATYAWSTGFEVLAPMKSWPRDRAGVAFSRQKETDRTESVAEGYYRHFLTDNLAVSLNLQWLFSGTNSVTGQKNRNIVVPGMRTTIDF